MSINGEAIRVSHAFVMKNMFRYMRPHERSAHYSCENSAPNLDLGLPALAARSCWIITLAVRETPLLASYIEIYYFLFGIVVM